jgi:hypothetical protein
LPVPVRTDSHQHLWTEPLLSALARRCEPPLVRRQSDGWRLVLDGEPESWLDPAGADADHRTRLLGSDDIDRALVALSCPLGIEDLPPAQADPLIEAYHRGARELPHAFGAWASLPSADLDPSRLEALLDEGFIGLTLPATAVCTPAGLERCSPVLEALERRDAPLFVHPGAATGTVDTPAWWPALTDYVAQMNAAWHAFVVAGRPSHPRLRVLFAMLAGGAPLHAERLAARRGPAGAVLDPGFFYDTSSYGTRAVDALIRVVGVGQIVFGSDRPVAKPAGCALGAAVERAARVTNPARLLGSMDLTA